MVCIRFGLWFCLVESEIFFLIEVVFDVGEELLVLGFVKLGFTDMSKKDMIFVNWYLFNFDLE